MMAKVWVVASTCWDKINLLAAFTSREKAEEYARAQPGHCEVVELEVRE